MRSLLEPLVFVNIYQNTIFLFFSVLPPSPFLPVVCRSRFIRECFRNKNIGSEQQQQQ